MTGRRESLVPERITVEVPAGRVAASRVAGPSPPMICLHGAGVSSREFRPLLEASAGRRDTWALDLPGFGDSAGLAGSPTVKALADWLVDWLDAADIPEAHLLGCSFGCQVAVEAALRNPGRVRSLVLVGPTTDPRARSLPRQAVRWCRNAVHEPPGLGPPTFRDYRDAGWRRVVSAFVESVNDRPQDKLPHVIVPALVIRGEHDTLVPQAWAEEVTRLLPYGRLVVWPGAAHMVPFSDPRGLAERVWRYLREVPV